MNKITLVFLVLAAMVSPTGLSAEDLAHLTRELNGTSITYEYTSGRSYNVKFEDQGVSYRYLNGSKPETWWGPFPYQAFRVSEGVYFTSWFEGEWGQVFLFAFWIRWHSDALWPNIKLNADRRATARRPVTLALELGRNQGITRKNKEY